MLRLQVGLSWAERVTGVLRCVVFRDGGFPSPPCSSREAAWPCMSVPRSFCGGYVPFRTFRCVDGPACLSIP